LPTQHNTPENKYCTTSTPQRRKSINEEKNKKKGKRAKGVLMESISKIPGKSKKRKRQLQLCSQLSALSRLFLSNVFQSVSTSSPLSLGYPETVRKEKSKTY
jgi:hypothetical protein